MCAPVQEPAPPPAAAAVQSWSLRNTVDLQKPGVMLRQLKNTPDGVDTVDG